MKRFSFRLAAAMIWLPAMVSAQDQTNISFTVKGKIGHYAPPYKIYLGYPGIDGWTVDSVLLQDGQFSFSGEVKTPRKAQLSINTRDRGVNPNRNDFKELYLEQEMVTIEGPDSLSNSKVSGGKVNADFEVFQKMQQPADEKSAALYKEWAAASVEEKKSQTFTDNIDKKNKALTDEHKQIALDFMKQYPDSWVSLYTLREYEYGGADLTDFKPLFNAFSSRLRSSSLGVYLDGKIQNSDKTAMGTPAMDFTLPDVSGKKVSLHDFKGKYVLIDFWASWCGPCRAENPNVVRAYAAYKNKGFTVLGVSLDDSSSKSKWIAAIRKDKLNWPQVSDLKGWQSQPVLMFGVTGIPQNFLISPDGKIVAKNLRGEELDKKLKELL